MKASGVTHVALEDVESGILFTDVGIYIDDSSKLREYFPDITHEDNRKYAIAILYNKH